MHAVAANVTLKCMHRDALAPTTSPIVAADWVMVDLVYGPILLSQIVHSDKTMFQAKPLEGLARPDK